jgi:mono/diheme cytochrome c family protein
MPKQLSALLILCAIFIAAAVSGPTPSAGASRPWPALANGRSIFMTGRDLDGRQIVAQTRPLYGRCAACHRADGSGGLHFPDGAVSADLRHAALVEHQRHPYTLVLLERAISTGIDNDGHKLDPVMPRWRLSARDLHDVALYVLTQLK